MSTPFEEGKVMLCLGRIDQYLQEVGEDPKAEWLQGYKYGLDKCRTLLANTALDMMQELTQKEYYDRDNEIIPEEMTWNI